MKKILNLFKNATGAEQEHMLFTGILAFILGSLAACVPFLSPWLCVLCAWLISTGTAVYKQTKYVKAQGRKPAVWDFIPYIILTTIFSWSGLFRFLI